MVVLLPPNEGPAKPAVLAELMLTGTFVLAFATRATREMVAPEADAVTN
jgi:hypothetical protein